MVQIASWPAWRRFAIAGALVSASFCIRLALQPVFGSDHAYTVFYPVVIISAYFLGAGPAVMSAFLAAGAAYFAFASPGFSFKLHLSPLLTLAFFAMTSTVSIYFITGMARAMRERAAAQGRAEDLAKSHAALFNHLNERVANHLQLVAAVLQLQARGEPNAAVSDALTEASARTLLISRTHRSLGDSEDMTLDFEPFARSLLDQAVIHDGSLAIDFDLSGVRLSADQATSVAVVLLNCVKGRLATGKPSRLRIAMREDSHGLRLSVEERDSTALYSSKPMLVEAMVEQLCGRLTENADLDGVTSELVFPRAPGVGRVPATVTRH